MRQLRSKPLPYYLGIHSLEELVTKDNRVCVVNILGNESSKVTPVSHVYSGNNIVAGVQYGRTGKLETPVGDIPVYPSVREVMNNGHTFDVGVVYLPPTAVSQAVSELVTFNHDLKRVIIVTEKVSIKDSRNIRFLCQEAGVDVIGCNCLGVANVWDHVRIGGALGGDKPEETLRKGSIAIHSNSGNFTTTISEYLRTQGFGLTTAVSSGKDVYIHFALAEFLFAAQNDPRTKAVALYVEPGGYYERTALDMIKYRRFCFNKPMVVCVTGRWKKDISRSCGHAGALAGSGNDALAKEAWFDEYLGAEVFDPENPVVSKRGVRVASIQDFPSAMKAVFAKIDEPVDFEPEGDLNLKPWLGDSILPLPKALEIPLITPIKPYDEQLDKINKQVGAQYLRRPMVDTSGASRMDSKSQVTELHRTPILDLSNRTLEENIFFSLAKETPAKEDLKSINLLLNLLMKHEKHEMEVVARARANGATPNGYLGAGVAALGNQPLMEKARSHTAYIIDLIREFGIDTPNTPIPAAADKQVVEKLLVKKPAARGRGKAPALDPVTEFLLKEVLASKKKCTALKVCQHILALADKKKMTVRDLKEFLLASIALCLFWGPMLRKRISRQLVEDVISYFMVTARLFAYSVIDPEGNDYWQRLVGPELSGMNASFSENAYRILFNRKPNKTELAEFKYLVGLTLSNGPGTLSAKGGKQSVSARNHISMTFVGYLSGCGLAHGGNGFEAVAFLLRIFKDQKLTDPGNAKHGIDLKGLAAQAASEYAEFKAREKAMGALRVKPIPCINHPVFKGHAINIDPREEYVRKQFEEQGIYNIFLDFYHHLVKELHRQGVTRNVFCVNIDAVLAVISLKLAWKAMKQGDFTDEQIQNLGFTLFLYGRTIGVSAEIADHRDRGRDMDCRTPQSAIKFVL